VDVADKASCGTSGVVSSVDLKLAFYARFSLNTLVYFLISGIDTHNATTLAALILISGIDTHNATILAALILISGIDTHNTTTLAALILSVGLPSTAHMWGAGAGKDLLCNSHLNSYRPSCLL
jgi:hypothetical protein